MSERLSQDERKCFDKIFQIVRGKNGTLDKLEAFAELGNVINDDWSKIIAYLARARAIKEQREKEK